MTLGSKTRNLLLLIAAPLLMIFAADLFVRFMYPIPAKGYGVWAAYPGSELELIMEPDDFRAIHRYNRFGFRGPDFGIDRKTDIRIVCVGDSYTEGVGAEEEATWPSVLAAELSDLEAEVINLGDSGSSLARYASILSKVALPLTPTDVILCVNTLDLRHGPQMAKDLSLAQEFHDPFRENRGYWTRSLMTIVPGWIYLIERVQGRWPIQAGLYWNAYTNRMTEIAARGLAGIHKLPIEEAMRIVEERIKGLADGILSAAIERKFNPSVVQNTLVIPYWTYECRMEDIDLPAEMMTKGMLAWLQWYASICRKQRARPWLLYFPEASLVMDGNWGPLKDHLYSMGPKVVGDTSVRDMMKKACARLGIGFIDATPVLAEHGREQLFFRYDPHPTSRAYELVAQAVAQEIRPVLKEFRGKIQSK
ncbi:MAG: hypothetical protein GTO29_11970 [Candidatus Latescibacteria bacterium]|nr:hypothetical protein [Candidatus Latescibacterota bacterium]NIO56881.1 hypothetical protein [Candidatus Latescibacterota bacterium]